MPSPPSIDCRIYTLKLPASNVHIDIDIDNDISIEMTNNINNNINTNLKAPSLKGSFKLRIPFFLEA